MVDSTGRSKAVVPVLVFFLLLCGYSTRRFVFSLVLCYFVTVFSVLLALRLPRLGKRELILVLFVSFFRFALVWFCQFPLPLGVRDGLWLVIVALPRLFSYLFSNARNKTLTAKRLQQRCRYHKLRKAFF